MFTLLTSFSFITITFIFFPLQLSPIPSSFSTTIPPLLPSSILLPSPSFVSDHLTHAKSLIAGKCNKEKWDHEGLIPSGMIHIHLDNENLILNYVPMMGNKLVKRKEVEKGAVKIREWVWGGRGCHE